MLTSVLKDGHVAADHACTVLANLVDNSNDRTFQFLGVDGVTHMLKLLDYQKPRQVGILVLVARLIPQVPMDALERIASSPALQSFFKAFSENKLHDIVACITLVILRLFAKCGRYRTRFRCTRITLQPYPDPAMPLFMYSLYLADSLRIQRV